MTGGQAEIQNIQPYDNQFQDREDTGNYDLGLLESQRYHMKTMFIHFNEIFFGIITSYCKFNHYFCVS